LEDSSHHFRCRSDHPEDSVLVSLAARFIYISAIEVFEETNECFEAKSKCFLDEMKKKEEEVERKRSESKDFAAGTEFRRLEDLENSIVTFKK
jgi:hypothetical protein